jgi:hypothetical protein
MKRAQNLERVRQLVLQHGWNATTYQLLNPGIRHWFSAAGDAVVGYVVWRNVWVVAGAPVCAEERLDDVVESFERAAASVFATLEPPVASSRCWKVSRGTHRLCWAPGRCGSLRIGRTSSRAMRLSGLN